jgi:hypothetical protein
VPLPAPSLNHPQVEAERAAVLAEERASIERLLTAVSATLNQDLPARLAAAVRAELEGLGERVGAAVAPSVQAALSSSLPKVGWGGCLGAPRRPCLRCTLALPAWPGVPAVLYVRRRAAMLFHA